MILPCDQQKRPKAKWNVHSIKKVSFQLKTIFFQQNASVHLRNLITKYFLIRNFENVQGIERFQNCNVFLYTLLYFHAVSISAMFEMSNGEIRRNACYN